MVPVIAWSAWRPHDRLTWWMEVVPVYIAFIGLFISEARGWKFSNFALWMIGFHMVILLIGGHYTYALVPIGDWVSAWAGFERNHYDRLGHLTQGFVPAIVCREIFLRREIFAKPAWLGFFVFTFCLAFSALYELIEWLAALISAEGAAAFLGTQGDIWDTQWDMFLAGLGALMALILTRKIHDRSIRRLETA